MDGIKKQELQAIEKNKKLIDNYRKLIINAY
jgi:hypothetical protein